MERKELRKGNLVPRNQPEKSYLLKHRRTNPRQSMARAVGGALSTTAGGGVTKSTRWRQGTGKEDRNLETMAMTQPCTTVKLSDALTAIMEDKEWWLHPENYLFSGLLAIILKIQKSFTACCMTENLTQHQFRGTFWIGINQVTQYIMWSSKDPSGLGHWSLCTLLSCSGHAPYYIWLLPLPELLLLPLKHLCPTLPAFWFDWLLSLSMDCLSLRPVPDYQWMDAALQWSFIACWC